MRRSTTGSREPLAGSARLRRDALARSSLRLADQEVQQCSVRARARVRAGAELDRGRRDRAGQTGRRETACLDAANARGAALAHACVRRFELEPARGYGAGAYGLLSRVSMGASWREDLSSNALVGFQRLQKILIIAAKFLKPHQPPYDAWDPLAAVAVRHADVLQQVTSMDLEVVQSGTNSGQTVQGTGTTNSQVALSADADAFRRDYKAAFGS
jgi:hypothetical protein